MKIYNAAVAALSTKYTGNTIDMHVFVKNVKERSQAFGWQATNDVPKDGGIRNLTEQNGLPHVDDIRAHASTYKNVRGRDAQNLSQMYSSCTPRCLNKPSCWYFPTLLIIQS